MFLKGTLKDSSFIVQFLFLAATFIAGILFSNFLLLIYELLLTLKTGFSTEAAFNAVNHVTENGDSLRVYQLLQTLSGFLFPAIFLSKLYSDDEKEYLSIENRVPISIIGLTVLSLFVLIPFLNLTIYINGMFRLPESLSGLETKIKELEEMAKSMTELVLATDKIPVILLNFLIIAVLAAISEEFFFRGVLQNVFHKLTKNHHLVIWIVAILFSAIHFQFYGFIPRTLLGAYFGYLLYYSKCIWIPVVGHFTNNAIGVCGYYGASKAPEINKLDLIGAADTWYYGIISFTLWLVIFILIIRRSKSYHFTS